MLIPFGSNSPKSRIVAAHTAAITTRLGFLVAHRPGFTQPTLAARQLATLGRLSGGRVAVHIITGGADEEMARDGDTGTHKAERYTRTDESVDAWAIWPPFISVALEEGAHTIVDARDYELPASFDVAYVAAIAPKAALMRDFLQREARALAWARANPATYAKVLATETGLPLDIARQLRSQQPHLGPIDATVVAHERTIAGRFAATGLIAATRPVDQAFVIRVGTGLFQPLAANGRSIRAPRAVWRRTRLKRSWTNSLAPVIFRR